MTTQTAPSVQRRCTTDVPGSDESVSRRTHPVCAHGEDGDALLLERWRSERCKESFAKLVARHTSWICALARRCVKDRHLAEDVTQAVFLILSKKANRIGPDTPLSAWLFRVTRFAANDAIKREARSRRRIERAAAFSTDLGEEAGSDPDIDVDECIACLGEVDRQVVLLRFYEDKSMAQLAQSMGITEHAAKKRVARALNRLRRIFARRGIRVGTLLSLATLLRQTGSTEAALVGESLVQSITQASIGAGPSTSIAELANATVRSLATAQARILAAMAGASVILCLAVNTLSPVMGQALLPLVQKVRAIFVEPTIAESSSTLALPSTALAPADVRAEPVKQVWAGRTGEFAWPLLPGPGGSISLQSIQSTPPRTVAIVEDAQGLRWVRRIDDELVPPSPDHEALRSYTDLNPYLNSRYQQPLLNQVAEDLTMFHSANSTSPDAWRPLDSFGIQLDGDIHDNLFIDMNYAEAGPTAEGFDPVNVPEPAFAGVALGLVLLRRWRKS